MNYVRLNRQSTSSNSPTILSLLGTLLHNLVALVRQVPQLLTTPDATVNIRETKRHATRWINAALDHYFGLSWFHLQQSVHDFVYGGAHVPTSVVSDTITWVAIGVLRRRVARILKIMYQ